MKPFDLEAAKRGMPICTRSGESVKFITHVPEAQEEGSRVLVLTSRGTISHHYDDGFPKGTSGQELFMTPRKEKREGWINVYPYGACIHNTKELADKEATRYCIACVHVEYEIEVEE